MKIQFNAKMTDGTILAVEGCFCKCCVYANEDGTICRYRYLNTEPDHFCSEGEVKEQ